MGTATTSERLPARMEPGVAGLPGYEPSVRDEPLLTWEEAASHIVEDITASAKGLFALYGHCAGSTLTTLAARESERRRSVPDPGLRPAPGARAGTDPYRLHITLLPKGIGHG
ncbi:hypothetical protein [Streptomyces sp. H27-D2]|uniref:hypothetical protein n=1 Tax=Streptomyces sp. H27-D2 TaxID=3046304 RepID=UPI002DBC8CB5|nr:hypothetical protein [Streptomyces sp. H27-D2]MEC4016284.1 hypothetical protein [Streptomyces sp. H27-D2]